MKSDGVYYLDLEHIDDYSNTSCVTPVECLQRISREREFLFCRRRYRKQSLPVWTLCNWD